MVCAVCVAEEGGEGRGEAVMAGGGAGAGSGRDAAQRDVGAGV